jgi:peptide/nickel transport system substrate-binding protein
MSPSRKFNPMIAAVIILSVLLSACAAPAAPAPAAPAPAAPAVVEPTKAPEAAPPAAAEPVAVPAASEKYGGILRHAYFAPTVLDPAFYSSISDEEIGRQWGDYLVYIDEDLRPDPSRSLAEKWETSADGLTWTFSLRQGVNFTNGEPLTSKDVKFTFDRLRDPELGTATVGLLSNITDITTPDDATVVFTLNTVNPDFLADVADYHSVILWNGIEDPKTEAIGTGAFIVESYLPEDRMVFKRNPNFWRKDADGNQLPYLDGMEFIFMAEPSAQVEALRGGQVDYLLYLPTEFVPTLEQDPNVVVYKKPSNTHFVVHMRSDREPFEDVRVRQAFKLAVDRKAILDAAFEGLGVTGRDTPFGPAYSEIYLDVPELMPDIAKAKQLLTDAGYADGMEIALVAQQISPVPAMATILKEQLAQIGVNVEIQLMPSDVYYGADNVWLEADFAITDWGARAVPQTYLTFAYTCAAEWNESHWCDQELDDLATAAASELDTTKRKEIYAQIQRIFIDRGPVIIPFFGFSLWGASADLQGIVPTGYLGTAVDLSRVYFQK